MLLVAKASVAVGTRYALALPVDEVL
jgi:hypothetical protein